jgi:uncharacterized protein YbaP (TraB family)
MTSPCPSVALTIDEIEALNKQLSTMRHDINNHLSLMMAALELIRRKPDAAERMSGTIAAQPEKITEAMKKFSADFEAILGIKRV